MPKYVKNDSGVTKSWIGVELVNTEVFMLPHTSDERWINAANDPTSDVAVDITSGDLKVSDDNFATTLSVADGLDLVKSTNAGCIRMVLVDDSAKADGKVLTYSSTSEKIEYSSIPDGDKISENVNQASHGLVVGNVVRHNGTAFVKAQADSQANSEAIGIVSAVADASNFTIIYGGKVSTLSGLTAGQVYFLSDSTAGLLASAEPVGVSKPILFATSATEAVVIIMRGIEQILSVIPPSNNFGTEYEYAESEAETTTNSTSFVTKLSHTTAALPSADYRIGFQWKPGIDTNAVLAMYQVTVNGVVIANPDFESDSDHHQWSGFKKMSLSGAQTINIDYKSPDGVALSEMSHARIEIWRVS